jgi:hypothetical protein
MTIARNKTAFAKKDEGKHECQKIMTFTAKMNKIRLQTLHYELANDSIC